MVDPIITFDRVHKNFGDGPGAVHAVDRKSGGESGDVD